MNSRFRGLVNQDTFLFRWESIKRQIRTMVAQNKKLNNMSVKIRSTGTLYWDFNMGSGKMIIAITYELINVTIISDIELFLFNKARKLLKSTFLNTFLLLKIS